LWFKGYQSIFYADIGFCVNGTYEKKSSNFETNGICLLKLIDGKYYVVAYMFMGGY